MTNSEFQLRKGRVLQDVSGNWPRVPGGTVQGAHGPKWQHFVRSGTCVMCRVAARDKVLPGIGQNCTSPRPFSCQLPLFS